MNELDKEGCRWKDGSSPKTLGSWSVFKQETLILVGKSGLNEISFANIHEQEFHSEPIIEVCQLM